MKIRVTQEHIDAGTQRSATGCPVAQALINQLVGADSIRVLQNEVEWECGGNLETCPLPQKAQQRIIRYDKSGKMRPFEFEIPTK